ncbi:MAG: hypothetical protein ACW986_18280 [Promethearchaeota archaeon]|jgi:hypothetical protein
MTEEEIRSQISAREDEITRVEEEASKKDASAESEIEELFDQEITAAKATLDEETGLRDEAIEKAAEWTQKKKEKITAAKNANKAHDKLRNDKTKALNDKLKAIETEKKNKIKDIQKEINGFKKQLIALEKAKAKEAAAAEAEE